MEVYTLGTSKKAVEEKMLKFLKRLGTIEGNWLLCGDIWVPTTRSAKTRPGMHSVCNPRIQLNPDCMEYIYVTEPITVITVQFDNIEGRIRRAELIQNPEMLTMELTVQSTNPEFVEPTIICIVIAYRVYQEDLINKYPRMFQGTTFSRFLESQGYWTEIPNETLFKIKQGNLFQLDKDGLVMMRLTRNMFKLRGRSERKDTPVDYTARYCIITNKELTKEKVITIGFLLHVDYGFMEALSNYIAVPYPVGAGGMIPSEVDLGLFDEDDADDGLEVVD